jgi:hypothetical protein
MKRSKRALVIALGVLSAVGLSLPVTAWASSDGRGGHGESERGESSTLAVYGDSPYGTTPTDTAQLTATPAFINSINSDPNVDRVFQVGDIHSGKQFCTESYDRKIFDLWKGFRDPLVYTPGDNETTDCHKVAEGGGAYNPTTGQIDYVVDANGNPVDYAKGDPVKNLELIRSIFFARPGRTLGGNREEVLSQASAYDRNHPSDRKFVENVIWAQSGVVFVTINLPGGSNNDKDVWYGTPSETPAQTQARQERTGADLRWLDTAFGIAKRAHAEGVVIGAQADMWDPEKGAAHQAGYEPFVSNVAANTMAFGGPVLMFNGDSHVYRSDNPLSASAPCTWEASTPCSSVAFMHPGYEVPSFHRVVVHGSTTPLEWLELTVEPRAHAPNGAEALGPFAWRRHIQP